MEVMKTSDARGFRDARESSQEISDIKEKIQSLKLGKLKAQENIKSFLAKIKKEDKEINSFLQINENAIEEAKEIDAKIKEGKAGKLAGLAIAVKANINVYGMTASCASKTLEDYKSAYDATVISKIKKEDGIIIGITNMDEFACGSSGETSAFGPVKNPVFTSKIPGGSSSGSAAAVAAGFCDLAVGSDTGGSIRNPASHCGIVGVKPSYGRVSRYGLIDLSMSLDQIGTFSKEVYGSALLASIISGSDDYDPTTFNEKVFPYHEMLDIPKNITVGISEDLTKLTSDTRITKNINAVIDKSKKFDWRVKNVELNHVGLAVQAYYPICYVEFFSGTRKFNGRNYGKKIEDVAGPEVLRRIFGGSEISKAEYHGLYYRRALKAMQLIKRDFDNAFKTCDVIISATVPRLPHDIGGKISVEEMYGYDALTIPANLAGICAINVPIAVIDKCPVGIQIMAPSFKESRMFQVAAAIQQLRNQI
jgi:aspartyl-tRNA(Asn)/glutamyl-tRNA(Gln) amidotransferase subunit A